MVLGEAGSAVVCATLVRDAQAMLPEPDDKPRPKSEPEDDLDDEPKDDPDTPVPRARGPMHGPMLLKSNITRQPPGGADTADPAGLIAVLQGCVPQACPPQCGDVLGAASVFSRGSLSMTTRFLRGGQ